MRFPAECYQMQKSMEHYMPHLRESQLKGLVLWVYGAILAGSACQNAVGTALSFMGSFNSIRQYSQRVAVRRTRPRQPMSSAAGCE